MCHFFASNKMARRRAPPYYDPEFDIKEFYCGEGPVPDDYERRGTRAQCLRCGVGIGRANEFRVMYPNSLLNIPYANLEIVAELRRRTGVRTLNGFLRHVDGLRSYTNTHRLLRSLFGNEHQRVYNTIYRFLYRERVTPRKIPATRRVV